MATTKRVVVLMTPGQKKIVDQRARAENMSLSEYMRRQALGHDELLEGLLRELRDSTAKSVEALDRSIARLEAGESSRAQADADARERARLEFADVDPEAFAQLVTPGPEGRAEAEPRTEWPR